MCLCETLIKTYIYIYAGDPRRTVFGTGHIYIYIYLFISYLFICIYIDGVVLIKLIQIYIAFRPGWVCSPSGPLGSELSDFCITSRITRIGAPSGPPSWRVNGLLEPSGVQQRFWGLQRELFRPAERGSGASREPFQETFRCHKAQIASLGGL